MPQAAENSSRKVRKTNEDKNNWKTWKTLRRMKKKVKIYLNVKVKVVKNNPMFSYI